LVDAHRFRALVATAASTTAPASRIRLLERALGLWRGVALADAASAAMRQRVCVDLEELRLTATEDLLAARLVVGGARQVLPELVRWSRAHPSRERLAELRMRALHEDGRTADALLALSMGCATAGAGGRSLHAP
jgi:DNA-binding SARP family transcriptional activator